MILRRRIMVLVDGAVEDYIDLGLPSGTLWAKGNLVKDSQGHYSIGRPTEQGTYLSWGNIDGHNEGEGYNFNSTNYSSTTGYSVSADISSNDAAHDICFARLGIPWYLPTEENFQELYDYTDTEWATINGVNGLKFMKKSDHSVYIFIPARGYYLGSSTSYINTRGYYWSSSYVSSDSAKMLRFDSSEILPQNNASRYFGFTVRPICKPIFTITITLTGDSVSGITVTVTDSENVSRSGITDANGVVQISDMVGGNATVSASGRQLDYNSITVSASSTSFTIPVVSFQPIVTDYTYTGSSQTIILQPGTYKLECWGAQGGYSSGGKGGYAVGTIVISEATIAYIYVGGKGDYRASRASSGGFNGGGNAYSIGNYYSGSGGGASDIRIGEDSLSARVIVAGGGGGAGRYNATQGWQAGGYGGGSSGGTGTTCDSSGAKAGQGGSQSSRGASYYGNNYNSTTYGTLAGLGVGGGAKSGVSDYRTVGGGGGYYGGGYSQRAGAGGGSGYVGNLSNAQNKAGNTSFPAPSGGNETGHSGNGFIRITQTA